MQLSSSRIINPGQTPHDHESRAFELVVRELPDTDPFQLWAFVELIDPSGRRYDLDLLVIGLGFMQVEARAGELGERPTPTPMFLELDAIADSG